QSFLHAQRDTDSRADHSTHRLQRLSQQKLVQLQGQKDHHDVLATNRLPADFVFSSKQGDNLVERLSSDDSFRVLLGQGRSQQHTQGPADLQSLRATSEHMRSVLKSIQPQKQPDLAKPLLSSIQRKQPILSPAPLGNAQPSTSKGAVNALNAKPSTLKSASYAETAPACRKPSLDRKRDAEGRLRKENNYQAGTAYSNTSGPAARCRVEAESAGADDDDAVEEDDVQQGKHGGFISALQWEKRMKGQTYMSKGHTTSSQESDHAGKRQPFKLPAPADNGQKRSGMLAPFKPPHKLNQSQKRAPTAEDEGQVSAKSLEMLAGPDGELPAALQKVEPAMLELVCNEIVEQGGHVQWSDIAGQDQAKRLVQELVVWPMLNPHLFKGARAPAKGLLLFGPPGTGKTLIGKAIASNIKATFFNISASSLTSKWIGQGEKMVRALFAVAGCMQPAVIFVDEIDSILSARKSEGEHEASRRLKTEMLVQMEGCDPSSAERRVLLVGATNRPEELDEAARRRMPKQLYIPLPCAAARRQMIERQLGNGSGIAAELSETDLSKIVAKTEGYSGSDMRNLIQEACQGPVRNAMGQAAQLSALAQLSEADLRPVILKDFQIAAKAQRASVEPAEVVRYEEYDNRHGARYVDASAAAADMEEEW
ncbi:MAG: fidgetin 1-like, partial [Trebouxia sp. A1-2]